MKTAKQAHEDLLMYISQYENGEYIIKGELSVSEIKRINPDDLTYANFTVTLIPIINEQNGTQHVHTTLNYKYRTKVGSGDLYFNVISKPIYIKI